MGFLNLELLKQKYTEGFMKDNTDNLIEFEQYHCLLSSNKDIADKVKNMFGRLPKEYYEWLKLCDGGLLFDTVLLSTKATDKELDLDFDTFEELNSDVAKKVDGIPEGYAVIAMRSYGDPICINIATEDEQIYLWDVHKQEFTDIWKTFTDWITEEIDDAIQLIADDALEILFCKL